MHARARIGCFLVSCVLLSAGAFGCKEKATPVADTMINAVERSRDAADVATLDALKKAVQAYRAANDRNPAALQDVGSILGAEVDFSKFDYDPQTGTVSLKK